MKKFVLSFVVLLSLITAGCANANSTALQASGQIEAKEIAGRARAFGPRRRSIRK